MKSAVTSRVLVALALVAVSFCPLLSLSAADATRISQWHIADADFRVKISKTKATKRTSTVGQVELFPYGTDAGQTKIAVTTPTGKVLGSQVLWQQSGMPLKILFDTSSRQEFYYIYFGSKQLPAAPSWQPNAGLVLETRKRPDGNANNWKEAKSVWDKAKPVLGKSVVDEIFSAVHPHGPANDFCAYYRGFLHISKPGKYTFATVSDDASFLLIDGKMVAQWPGWHGPWGGRRGNFKGSVSLAKGRHMIEYYNIQNGTGYNVSAAWLKPGEKQFKVIPANTFYPIDPYHVTDFDRKDEKQGAYFSWSSGDYLYTDGRSIVHMLFNPISVDKRLICKWFFDDNEVSRIRDASHVFLAPGLRTVTLEVSRPGATIPLAKATIKVLVSPDWQQRQEFPKRTFKQLLKSLPRRRFDQIPPDDIANLVAILEETENRREIADIGKACLKRPTDMQGHGELLYRFSQCYIHHEIRDYNNAEKAYQMILASKKEKPELIAKAQLYYGAFKVHLQGKSDEGLKLLNSLDKSKLADHDKRKRIMWTADALATKGDVAEARKMYLSAPQVVDRSSSRFHIRNEAHVLNAQDFLRRKEYNAAEKLIWWIEWEYPEELLNPVTGLVMTRIFIGRQEYQYALWRCMRLLNAAQTDRQMADILMALVEINFLMGKKDTAQQYLQRLLKSYPYSEAAALAKDKWPGLAKSK